jgi:hypothetical protein
LDIENGRNLVLRTANGSKSQIFYFDKDAKTLRNKSTGKSISISDSGRGNNIELGNTSGGWY